MDVKELKGIMKAYRLSRAQMAEKLKISIETLNHWEYRTKKIPPSMISVVQLLFPEYFENSGKIIDDPKSHLDEKERAIRFLENSLNDKERTILDKEEILSLQKSEIARLKSELNGLKSSKQILKKND